MTASIAPQAKRYEIQYFVGQGFARVLDKKTNEFLTGPNGAKRMTDRDAHDLHQEYIWS